MAKTALKSTRPVYLVCAVNYLLSLVVSFAFILLFAFIISVADLSKSSAYPLSSVSLLLGAFCGGYHFSKNIAKNGILCGLSVGALLYFTFFVAGIIINGFVFSSLWFIRLLIVMLASTIGGIIGVNRTGTKRLVK